MKSFEENFTIIVNWKSRGFGCAKVCSYCNWRDSKLLPHGGQSAESISNFIKKCNKSFITISGGADPLYQFDDYSGQLLAMIRVIQSHGLKVRIITREVEHVAKLKGIVDYVSISLDADVMTEIGRHQHDWGGMDIEYSLVLPPLPTADILPLKGQYAALRNRLGRRLVLRENLNSIFPLDLPQLTFGHSGIVFVPKQLCLAGRYLSTFDTTGYEIVQDNERLTGYLMSQQNIVLFGGMVKHLLNPLVHTEYGDIDAIALSPDVIETLTAQFGYEFNSVTPAESYPRYYIGKSSRAGKAIQIILMHSKADAHRFIFNAQYDVDRIGYSNRSFLFDPDIGEAAIRQAICSKLVHAVPGPRSTDLFHVNRPQIEQRHKLKLIRRGFAISD